MCSELKIDITPKAWVSLKHLADKHVSLLDYEQYIPKMQTESLQTVLVFT
eukprot:Gb_16982 [translate_table: standard]